MRLGLDSLMALELRHILGSSFSLPLASSLLFDRPTLGALADYLLSPAGAAVPVADDRLLSEISALSEQEAERLLEEELGISRADD